VTEASEHAFSTEVQPADDPGALGQAVELLGQGQLVALPTETVYGLAADARSPGAVARIFEAKGRPAGNPLIVHIDSVSWQHGSYEIIEQTPRHHNQPQANQPADQHGTIIHDSLPASTDLAA